MKTLTFEINILAKAKKIWETLWNEESYTQWTKPFAEGCTYKTDEFGEGNSILFLSKNGDGMVSRIDKLIPNRLVAFEHLGMLEQGKETSFRNENDQHRYIESYELVENENTTQLLVKVDTLEPWENTMNQTFPKALEIIKALSE
jgi:hypothetical protein